MTNGFLMTKDFYPESRIEYPASLDNQNAITVRPTNHTEKDVFNLYSMKCLAVP